MGAVVRIVCLQCSTQRNRGAENAKFNGIGIVLVPCALILVPSSWILVFVPWIFLLSSSSFRKRNQEEMKNGRGRVKKGTGTGKGTGTDRRDGISGSTAAPFVLRL